MENLLSKIIETSKDIVVEYKRSKSPKFIKKKRANKLREELLKDIDKITRNNTCIPVQIISEYGSLLFDQFKPFGQYRNCRRVVKSAGDYINTIVFEFNMTEDDIVVVSIHSTNMDNSSCLINYSCTRNHKATISFTDTNITILQTNESIIKEYSDYGEVMIEKGNMIRNFASKCIIEDISEYLKSIIYEEELL